MNERRGGVTFTTHGLNFISWICPGWSGRSNSVSDHNTHLVYDIPALNPHHRDTGGYRGGTLTVSVGVAFRWEASNSFWAHRTQVQTYKYTQIHRADWNAALPVFLDAVLLRHWSIVLLTAAAAVKHQRIFETGLRRPFVRLVRIQACGAQHAWRS